jgi:hypothetical protein
MSDEELWSELEEADPVRFREEFRDEWCEHGYETALCPYQCEAVDPEEEER